MLVRTLSNLSARSDRMLRVLFARAAHGLPLIPQSGARGWVEPPALRDADARAAHGG
jgi:hypothetical protein